MQRDDLEKILSETAGFVSLVLGDLMLLRGSQRNGTASVLYYTILYYTILYYTIFYYILYYSRSTRS